MLSQALLVALAASAASAYPQHPVDFSVLDRQLANSHARFSTGQANAKANLASAAFLSHKSRLASAAQKLEADGVASGAAARHRKRGTGVLEVEKRGLSKEKRQSSATGYDALSSYYYGTDIVYLMTAKIGTSAQSFPMGLDTGSADMWVYGASIQSSTDEATYDPSKSSTAKTSNESWSITYGKGSEAGVLYTDTVAVGGYSVKQQAFAMANQVSDAFSDQPISGLFGFAFGALSGTGSTPFFESLISQGTLTGSQQYFSVFLNRAPLSTATGTVVSGGELCLGCIDSAKYTGSIDYLPVVSEGYWTVQADAVSVSGAAVSGTSFYAALDTGSSIITLPTATFNKFAKALGATAASSNDGYYVITCSAAQNVDVGIVFNGVEYKIAVDDLILGYVSSSDTSHCVLAIVPGNNVDFLGRTVGIVGDTFLKNAFAVFSYSENGAPAVGLAVSTNAPSGSGNKIGSSAASSAASSGATSSTSLSSAATSAVTSSSSTFSNTSALTSTATESTTSSSPALATVTITSGTSIALSTSTLIPSSTSETTSASASSISFASAQTVAVATPSVSLQTSFLTVDPSSSSADDATAASASATTSSRTSGAGFSKVGGWAGAAAAVGVVALLA